MVWMSFADLEEARRHHAALLDLILQRPGGWSDRESLSRIVDLCRAVGAAIEDARCAEHVSIVAEHAAELFSAQAHKRWARGNVSGADFLRLEIVKALHSLSRRLSEIEAARRVAKEPK